MGSGSSSLPRLRKALIIRAYNVRKEDETLDELFREYAHWKDNLLYISYNDIRKCLRIESGEYAWIDTLFYSMFGGMVNRHFIVKK